VVPGDGHRGFVPGTAETADAERPRDAKGWIAECMGSKTYRETTDQPAFTSRMDLQQAYAGSRSFRKLCSEWQKHSPR
jgi:hypothetical protein